jgi:hypothetical protein
MAGLNEMRLDESMIFSRRQSSKKPRSLLNSLLNRASLIDRASLLQFPYQAAEIPHAGAWHIALKFDFSFGSVA